MPVCTVGIPKLHFICLIRLSNGLVKSLVAITKLLKWEKACANKIVTDQIAPFGAVKSSATILLLSLASYLLITRMNLFRWKILFKKIPH